MTERRPTDKRYEEPGEFGEKNSKRVNLKRESVLELERGRHFVALVAALNHVFPLGENLQK